MSRLLAGLTATDLRTLAAEAASGRLARPYSEAGLTRVLGPAHGPAAARELGRLDLEPVALGVTLRALAAEREANESERPRLELVWTGPEEVGAGSRDTGVVVRELFSRAERRVLVSALVVYQGKRVFEALATRMAEVPGLDIVLCLNIERERGDPATDQSLVRRFIEDLRSQKWPTDRLPPVYYDPRALVAGAKVSRLHAKCVVVDDRWALVTSANLTEAAQERNIEAGVLVEDPAFARGLAAQFDTLIRTGQLARANPHE